MGESASYRYNDSKTECTVEVDECEFLIDDVKDGGLRTLTDDESGEQYVFSLDDEDLGSNTLYRLEPVDLDEDQEDDDDDAEQEQASA